MTTELLNDFQLTASAANKIEQLLIEENNPDLKLRVFVTGGGCAGFQYGFTFDECPQEDDFCIPSQGQQVLVDSLSMQYLNNATVDYQVSLEGSRFVVENPEAETTCGCGSSFSL